MNGLEAIRLMEQGKMVTSEYEATTYIFKIIDGNVCSKRIDEPRFLYQTDIAFNFSCDYQEYIKPKPLIGWERVKEGNPYRVSLADGIELKAERGVFSECDYKSANYFSTKEKAEEINFKQTLFRKLQRFSDENEGYKIYWNDFKQPKYSIYYNRQINELAVTYCRYISEPFKVYFLTEETAEKAIELFHDDLIKYFTM